MQRRPRLELPADPTIERLPGETRRAIGRHWIHRASAELSVALAFEELLPRLRNVGAADVVLGLAAKAIDDERRHGELCARLAARYLGTDVETPAPRDGALPDFGTGDEPTEVALITLGMCCINESIASEWIRSCWEVATAPTAIAANRHHLRDEIDHARLGWAHLGSTAISGALRQKLRSWVPKLLVVNVAQWKKPDDHLPPEGVPAHGHLASADNDDVIDAAVRDVVLPGFAHVGLA
ncbi:MAG: hypothetical protein K0S65_6666 [Labilithrix sp.]|nr:hypothetical protein [Labilithrix sp.]